MVAPDGDRWPARKKPRSWSDVNLAGIGAITQDALGRQLVRVSSCGDSSYTQQPLVSNPQSRLPLHVPATSFATLQPEGALQQRDLIDGGVAGVGKWPV